jgi:hypothetical protein
MAKKNMKTRRQRGGATPYYSFGAAVAPGAPYASKVIGHETVNVPRPGELATSANGMLASAGTGGLPGFTGGGRRRRRMTMRLGKMFRNAVKSTRKFFKRFTGARKPQRGGRYTVDLASGVGSTGPNVFAPVSRMACEGGSINTSPPGALPNPTGPMRGGRRRRLRGGAALLTGSPLTAAPLMGATPENTKFYEVPNAGYRNDASQWVSSTGTPSLIQTPYQAGASMSQSCLKTGGGKRRRASTRSKRNRR